jgi:hypothetical protein
VKNEVLKRREFVPNSKEHRGAHDIIGSTGFVRIRGYVSSFMNISRQ